MKLFFYLNIYFVLFYGCRFKGTTTNQEKNFDTNLSNCIEFSKQEDEILDLLQTKDLFELNENLTLWIYSEYYNNYFINQVGDTVYLAYLNVRPHYLTFRSLDSTSFEIGYNIVDSSCTYLDTSFHNEGLLILDFGISQSKSIDYFRNRRGQMFENTKSMMIIEPLTLEFRKFSEIHSLQLGIQLQKLLKKRMILN